MSKAKVLKLLITSVLLISVILVSNNIFAADAEGENIKDILGQSSSNTNTNKNTVSSNKNTNSNINTNKNTNVNTNVNKNISNNVNANLPSTGIATSHALVVAFIGILIIGVVAFVRAKYYSNI